MSDKTCYVVMRLCSEVEPCRAIPALSMKIHMRDEKIGLVGFLPVYATREDALAAWPGASIIAIKRTGVVETVAGHAERA